MRIVRGASGDRDGLARRSLFRGALIGSPVCHWLGEGARLRAGQARPAKRYDLLLKGGRVIDPSQELPAPRDVAILGRAIARVAADIPEADARHVLDDRRSIVTPGLIDVRRRIGHRKLFPVATIESGRLYGAATIPVPGSE